MKLLLDTDVFCKLSVIGLLDDAVDLLGADFTQCGRLPALPYMLKKGRLRTSYGSTSCDEMLQIALSIPAVVQASESWLDKLTPIQAIDAGEAQLFATGAEFGLLVMTGDKRALRALKNVGDFATALAGHIVVLEAVLIALCDRLGIDQLRQRAQILNAQDKMFQVCFPAGTPDPLECLLSYYEELKVEVDPLVLWDPRQ